MFFAQLSPPKKFRIIFQRLLLNLRLGISQTSTPRVKHHPQRPHWNGQSSANIDKLLIYKVKKPEGLIAGA
jgi:mRNA-degrading endonuclease YafQ of YafQ-DinJ toxin-antitoxin module